jgi:hypothetical protein
MLATVRPGPVLHVWRDGQEVARLPLDLHGALALVEALLREARAAQRGGQGSFLATCWCEGFGPRTKHLAKR